MTHRTRTTRSISREIPLVSCKNWKIKCLTLLGLVVAACGGAGNTDPTSMPQDATKASQPVESPESTVTGADGETTPNDPTAEAAASTSDERAAGGGVVIVDGAAIDVQPVACGWLSTRSSPRRYPLESTENSTHDFRLNAVAPVGEGGAFIIDLDADYTPGLEVIFLSVARAVPNDLGGTYIWSNERESAHRVEVTGNRIRTVDALHVLEDSTDVRSAEHEVTIDVVCETFGGALDDATQLAAEILGIDLPEPGGDATVTVDDLDYPLSVTACDTTADGTELTAESDDGAIALSLIDGPLSDVVFVGFHGKRWIRDRDVEILVDGNHFASDGPVELFDQFTGESVGMVQFEAICG